MADTRLDCHSCLQKTSLCPSHPPLPPLSLPTDVSRSEAEEHYVILPGPQHLFDFAVRDKENSLTTLTTGNLQKQIKTTHSTILLVRLRRRVNRRHHHGFHQRRLLRDAASLLFETGAISRLRRRSGGDTSQSVHRLRALVVLCYNDGAVTRHRTGVAVINLFFLRH
jgi:hypothetical protein